MPDLPRPQLRYVRVNDVRLAYFEWGLPKDAAPTLLFVHATGFHGRIWDYIIDAFAGDYHVVSLEQRGHGRSDPLPVKHWRTFGEDLSAFVQALQLRDLVGVSHSMGAHAMVDAAAASGAFNQLLLLDPTIAEPAAYEAAALAPDPFAQGLHPAAKRRDEFASPEEMMERLLPKSAFSLYHPRILRDYCTHGLVQQDNGRYQLCCRPEVEAHVYMTARTNGAIHESVAAVQVPVTVVRARLPPEDRDLADFTASPTWPGLAACFPKGRDLHWPECSHFIPMQMPDQVVTELRLVLSGDSDS